ncbi:1-phosphofructokinase [Spiroplasma sabaudiense Ar-1343]|uniref:1-phosphofructokinase n=1 Tax=Spiroplasma sabaudiense Ar-1343 TaxID=1276257 RepID=W6AAN5_9MOLU|nr:1-phosphofructokinase [Spiroplasma sabaudiense]AHI54076.1 1-phosphofructokinase [Spiroplasma sabaudiense Ar-1343]
MIYSITLNPAIDHIIESDNFTIKQTNYYQNEYQVVGGKGINVAIILNNLENQVQATGVMGAENKAIFLDKFAEVKVPNHFFFNQGKTRTNYKIKNLSLKEETELNGLGFTTEAKTWKELLDYLKKSITKDDIIVAAGSLAKGIPDDIYFEIGNIANQVNAKFILDATGTVMRKALSSKPFLIKPNIDEICGILNLPIKEYAFSQIKTMILELQKLGARNILLSMGSQGSYYFTENQEIYQTGIAQGKLVNSVGAGDSMLAGFTHGLSQNLDIEECLKLAAASGAATAFKEWLATKAEITALIDQIKVQKI